MIASTPNLGPTKLRVVLASSEVYPFSKTGGLGDMLGGLAQALASAGHEVYVVTPLYWGIRERFPDLERTHWDLLIPLGDKEVPVSVYERAWEPNLTVLFVDQPEFYERTDLYQTAGIDYPDNAERFVCLSKATVEIARRLPEPPDIVHAHDWQLALIPLLLSHDGVRTGWGTRIKTCLTIHNLAYQGVFPAVHYKLTNLPWEYFHPGGAEFFGLLNCLKAGIVYADTLTTVSPRYSKEILTESFGCGLDGVLRNREDDLTGILNGVDYREWNTEQNPNLKHSYSRRNLKGKALEKASLQKELGLKVCPETPLFGSVSRLVGQKGSDLLIEAFQHSLNSDLQLVLLGSGDPVLESAYRRLEKRWPNRVAIRIGYNHALAHRIEAGADFFVMPSRFEPCGLNQLYSLRYGTIPIVCATGGLDDSVIDLREDAKRANGIKFHRATADALEKAIRKALVLYGEPPLMKWYQRNGMKMDFSWERTSGDYVRLYQSLIDQAADRDQPQRP